MSDISDEELEFLIATMRIANEMGDKGDFNLHAWAAFEELKRRRQEATRAP